MNRALIYLAVRQRRNTLLHFLRGLRRPKRLIGALFWLLVLGLVLFSQLMVRHEGGDPGATASVSITAFLGFLLVASVLGGVVQRGIAFQPCDVDFLFPGPFSRRDLVLFRLLSIYPIALFSSAFLMLFLGPRMREPPIGFLGVLLCQVVGFHLQTAAAILVTRIGDRVFAKLRAGVQVVFVVVLACGMLALVTSLLNRGAMGEDVRAVFDSALVQKVLYPAAAAGRLAAVATLEAAWTDLLGLLLCAVGSLLLALSLPIDFFEASLETSKRFASVLSRARRGVAVSAPSEGERVRRVRLPELFFFRGAGAILWKNLITAARSLRFLLFGFLMAAFFSAVSLGVALDSLQAGLEERAAFQALGFGAFLPFLLQQHLSFDFRRDVESLAELKLLPVSPFALAAAEVAAPTLLSLLFQTLLFGVVLHFVGPPPGIALAPLVAYPLLTLAVCAVSNIGFLLFPVRTAGPGGRPAIGAASLSALLNLFFLMGAVLPAAATFALIELASGSTLEAFACAAVVQLLVDVLLLWLLGRLFDGYDVSRETT